MVADIRGIEKIYIRPRLRRDIESVLAAGVSGMCGFRISLKIRVFKRFVLRSVEPTYLSACLEFKMKKRGFFGSRWTSRIRIPVEMEVNYDFPISEIAQDLFDAMPKKIRDA